VQTSFTRSTLDPYEEYARWREWYESILLEQQNELRLARTKAIAEFIEETRKLDLNALSSPMRRPKVDLVMRRFIYRIMTFEQLSARPPPMQKVLYPWANDKGEYIVGDDVPTTSSVTGKSACKTYLQFASVSTLSKSVTATPSIATGVVPTQRSIAQKTTANDAAPISTFSPAIASTRDTSQPQATDEKSAAPATNQLTAFSFVSLNFLLSE
jgi:hypothetical protein